MYLCILIQECNSLYIMRNNNVLGFVIILVSFLFASSVTAQENDLLSPSRNDLKITMLSLGSGSTRVTYERAFNELNSGEVTVGIIGLGWDWMNHSDPSGLLLKFAYKWRLVCQDRANSMLGGLYVKPELVFADFRYRDKKNTSGEPSKCPARTNQIALLAECGYQLVVNWFVFDIYMGFGPSVGNGNQNNYFHSFMLFPKETVLAFTAGYRIGVNF